jgi:hypothetical protein
VLLRDLDLAILPAMDDRRVVGVHEPLVGMQLANQVVVRLGGLEIAVDADDDVERVECHQRTSGLVVCRFAVRVSR